MEVYDVVKKLIGEIDPVGETRADDKRFENLKAMCELVDQLLTDIDGVAYHRTRQEFSMSRAGKYASEFYTKMGID